MRYPSSSATLCVLASLACDGSAGAWSETTPQRGTTPQRAGEKAVIVALTVEPAEAKLSHRDDAVQLIVTARLSDGTLHDVTRAAAYTSSQAAVAQVPRGRLIP